MKSNNAQLIKKTEILCESTISIDTFFRLITKDVFYLFILCLSAESQFYDISWPNQFI